MCVCAFACDKFLELIFSRQYCDGQTISIGNVEHFIRNASEMTRNEIKGVTNLNDAKKMTTAVRVMRINLKCSNVKIFHKPLNSG